MTTVPSTPAPGEPVDNMPYPDSPHGFLTRLQIERLVKAIDHSHVEKKQGLSYIAQHQARAEMNRIFGFGRWDSQVLSLEKHYETSYDKNSKTYWITGWMATIAVNIRDYWGRPVAQFVEAHFEENAPQPNRGEANALAVTSVESYALRRALIGLGDRLGLGLYNDGKELPLVVGTLQLTDPESPHYKPPAPKPDTPPADRQAAFNQRNGESSAPGGHPEG